MALMAFGGDIPPCAGGIMGNLGHVPWPISETYGFHLDVLAALEGLCMATFSVPWADAPARPAMVDLQHTSFSFFPVKTDEQESIPSTYQRCVRAIRYVRDIWYLRYE